jgi:hypothetical protein
MEHSRAKVVGLLLTPFRISGLFRSRVTGETQVPPIHTLEPTVKGPKAASAKPEHDDLARLLKLAAAGHKGIDLGALSDEELDAWIKRH